MERDPTRLDQLFAFYREDPHDAFTIYAIATEYLKIDPPTAMEYYQKLLSEHESYVGTYYHAGKLHEQLGEKAAAEQVYKKGMLISRQAGNLHAFAELQQVYNKLMGLDYEEE